MTYVWPDLMRDSLEMTSLLESTVFSHQALEKSTSCHPNQLLTMAEACLFVAGPSHAVKSFKRAQTTRVSPLGTRASLGPKKITLLKARKEVKKDGGDSL